jgi:hypothetical protein
MPAPHDECFREQRGGEPHRESAIVPALQSPDDRDAPATERCRKGPEQRRKRHSESKQRTRDRQQQDVLDHVRRERRVGGDVERGCQRDRNRQQAGEEKGRHGRSDDLSAGATIPAVPTERIRGADRNDDQQRDGTRERHPDAEHRISHGE